MNLNEIIKTTNGVLVEEFEIDDSTIKGNANFRETLDLDSLDYVDLVVFVEENFGVKLTAEDFQTLGDTTSFPPSFDIHRVDTEFHAFFDIEFGQKPQAPHTNATGEHDSTGRWFLDRLIYGGQQWLNLFER